MKSLKKDLGALVEGLKAIATKVEKLSAKVDKEGEASKQKGKRGRPRESLKKARGSEVGEHKNGSMADVVCKIIKRRKNGIDTFQIQEKTGFDKKTIWNAIFRLKKEGKVKSIRKGIYGVVE